MNAGVVGGDAAVEDGCTNDDSVGDSYDDTCTDYYDDHPDQCGNYDTADFVSGDLCCACGGGHEATEVEETPNGVS